MTPRFFFYFVYAPAHLGVIHEWDTPRTRAAARHAPFVPALKPVYLLN